MSIGNSIVDTVTLSKLSFIVHCRFDVINHKLITVCLFTRYIAIGYTQVSCIIAIVGPNPMCIGHVDREIPREPAKQG